MLCFCRSMGGFAAHQGFGGANTDNGYQSYNPNTCQHTLHGRIPRLY
jgi:hypothetical protein